MRFGQDDIDGDDSDEGDSPDDDRGDDGMLRGWAEKAGYKIGVRYRQKMLEMQELLER